MRDKGDHRGSSFSHIEKEKASFSVGFYVFKFLHFYFNSLKGYRELPSIAGFIRGS